MNQEMMTNTRDLTGQVALVTRGNRGIGRAGALALAEVGADIVVNYYNRESEAEQVRSQAESYGGRCVTVRGNVALAGDVARCVYELIGAAQCTRSRRMLWK
jgi:3-oxoacyl-[acyl-carrier protein] reductase